MANLQILYISSFNFFFFCIIHNLLKASFIPLASKKSIKLFCKALPPNILAECLLLLESPQQKRCSQHDNIDLLPAKLLMALIFKKILIQLFKVNTVFFHWKEIICRSYEAFSGLLTWFLYYIQDSVYETINTS